MNPKTTLLLASLALSIPLQPTAHAQFTTGNLWLSRYQSSDFMDRAYAIGLVSGAIDSPSNDICLPPGVTLGQLAEMTSQLILRSPNMRHYAASAFILASAQTAFPCKQRGPSL